MSQARYTIRPLRVSDTEQMHEILHMPNVLWGTSLLPSITIESWRATIERWVTSERVHVFVAELNEKVVGAVRLEIGEGRASHIGVVTVVVHDKCQGQSIGKILLMTVIDLADNWLNLVRLETETAPDNERALHLFQRFDFEIEGRKRCSAFRGGSYIDSYMLGRIRSQQARAQQEASQTQTPTSANEQEADISHPST